MKPFPKLQLRKQLEAAGIAAEHHDRDSLWTIVAQRLGAPISECTVDELAQAVIYLSRHGYLLVPRPAGTATLH